MAAKCHTASGCMPHEVLSYCCRKAYVQTLSPAIWDHFMDILEKVPDLAEKGAPQPKAKRTRYWQINKCIHRTGVL